MNYIIRYKSKYRILPEIDKSTNDFPRNPDGSIEDIDCYISCQYNNKIYNYGHGTLMAYIPSIGRGHNIIKTIFTEYCKGDLSKHQIETSDKDNEIKAITDYESLYKDEILNKTIFNINETDEEIEFKFKAKDIDIIAELLKVKTSGASISPFSTRNLKKSNVTIPTDEMQRYKEISSKVDKSNLLIIHRITTEFLDKLLQKKQRKIKGKDFDYKKDIRKQCMARQVKEYIWTLDMWEEYLKYIDKEIDKFYSNK